MGRDLVPSSAPPLRVRIGTEEYLKRLHLYPDMFKTTNALVYPKEADTVVLMHVTPDEYRHDKSVEEDFADVLAHESIHIALHALHEPQNTNFDLDNVRRRTRFTRRARGGI